MKVKFFMTQKCMPTNDLVIIYISSLFLRYLSATSTGIVSQEASTILKNEPVFSVSNLILSTILQNIYSLTSNLEIIRIPFLLVSSLIPLVVFALTNLLYDRKSAIVASFLSALDVNLIAYGSIAVMESFLTLIAMFCTLFILNERFKFSLILLSLLVLLDIRWVAVAPIMFFCLYFMKKNLWSYGEFIKHGFAILILTTLSIVTIFVVTDRFQFYSDPLHFSKVILNIIVLKTTPPLLFLIPFMVLVKANRWIVFLPVMWLTISIILGVKGVKDILFFYALIYVIIGGFFNYLAEIKVIISKFFAIFFILLSLISTFTSFPSPISYISPIPLGNVETLTDSDVGWGEALKYAANIILTQNLTGGVAVNYAPFILDFYLKNPIYSIHESSSSYPRVDVEELLNGNVKMLVFYLPPGMSLPINEDRFYSLSAIYDVIDRGSQKVILYCVAEEKVRKIILWGKIASTAWKYFAPGYGINPKTGLNYATQHWHIITDWDLGSYIAAVIAAEELGLLNKEGEYGARMRIEKVVNFLLNRALHEKGVPYLAYNADNMEPATNLPTNLSDAGRLLLALAQLKQKHPELEDIVDKIVKRNNFEKIAFDENQWKTTDGLYAYYISKGYEFFNLSKHSHIEYFLSLPLRLDSFKKVQTYNVSLPATWINYEPLLLLFYETKDKKIERLLADVIQASINRYIYTGKTSAFSETPVDVQPFYVYEWISRGDEKTWIVTDHEDRIIFLPEVIVSQALIGMYAFNESEITTKMVNRFLPKIVTDNGFLVGVYESGKTINILSDKANSLILSIAKSQLEKLYADNVEYTNFCKP